MKIIQNSIFILIITLFSIFNFISCSSAKKIEALKPEPSTNKPFVYTQKYSYINTPIEIELSDIQQVLNQNLKGLIYNDSILNDDKTEMKIWKTANIELTNINGAIISKIPIKVWSKIKYGTEFLGLNDTREVNLNGVITLESKPNFVNWKLDTQSKIKDFEWLESPNVIIAEKSVPITYIVNPTLSLFKGKIAKMIDEAIAKNCDFKNQVLTSLEKVSEPFLADETYESWFKLIPTEIHTSPAQMMGKTIRMDVGMKCLMQTMIGKKPKSDFDKTKVTILNKPKLSPDFKASVAAITTYENASRILTKNFQNQEFGSGKKKVIIQKVDLWNKDNQIIIALEMLGSVTGTIYLQGVPKYNDQTKEIEFDNLDYVLNTKGLLTKTANWLLHGVILNKIKENCKYNISANIEEGEKSLSTYLNNYSPSKGIFINGKINSIYFESFELTNQGIVAFLGINGNMQVKIDGMN